ncbi:hypothetical protein SKAU_G00293500 [Synaphobranchus kaupii]|uniref:Uncharacterized protein n=1 Tax=Synaphobranchus kaupii TaxID=118154 RepID=A0A9Q1EU78_SYNKA|nr:hypothetical protein SKAU_G00293500 [Synaphobranchus kaupii]
MTNGVGWVEPIMVTRLNHLPPISGDGGGDQAGEGGGASRPGWSKSGRVGVARRGARRSGGRGQAAGLDFAGDGARRYEDIGGGGEPVWLMVM